MMPRHPALTLLCVTALLIACDQKPASIASLPASSAAPNPASTGAMRPPLPSGMAPPVPDVGHSTVVNVISEGYGANASIAVGEALRLALLQVNGASMDLQSINFNVDIVAGQSASAMNTEGFREVLRQRSGGLVQSFRLAQLDEPLLPAGRFKATIEAGISQFVPPSGPHKIRLVVADLHFDTPLIEVGGRSFAASEVGNALRQRIVEGLTNTGRFTVLDRDFGPEVQRELDLISNGNAPKSEAIKLGQASSADVIWIGKVNSLGYARHGQELRSSDRELVSYSGGWSISQRLVSVATRQILSSDTLAGQAPSLSPSTLGHEVNSAKVLVDMSNGLAAGVVSTIVTRMFPITVVAMHAEKVVLSQGGAALRAGASYELVSIGPEMKDPQTGQSLGHVETPCCQVVVDRVATNLAYGHLVNVNTPLEGLAPGALQVRAEQPLPHGTQRADNGARNAHPPKRGGSQHVPRDSTAVGLPADRSNDAKW